MPTRLKRLERAWKAFCFGLVFSLLRAGRRRGRRERGTRAERSLLILRPDGIGDAIVTTALLSELAARNPHLRIHCLASPRNAGFLTRLPYVERVHLFEKRRRGALLHLACTLRRERYDQVVECRVIEPSLTGLLLMLASGAPERIGIAGRGVDPALTTAVPLHSGHIIEQLAEFAPAFGIPREAVVRRPVLALDPLALERAERSWRDQEGAERAFRLLINISAGEPSRHWADGHFLEVIREARRAVRGAALTIGVVGDPSEAERRGTIAAAASAAPLETPSLDELIALIATSDAVVTPDTCVVHIAAAFEKPTVALFLNGTSPQWGAFRVPGANLESGTRSLADLPSQQVCAAVREMLDFALVKNASGSRVEA